MLDLDWGRLSDRVAADLPEHVQRPTRGLEAGGVDHPSVREVADEWGRPWVEGARGVRGGRDADAMVVARSTFAPSGICWQEGVRVNLGHPRYLLSVAGSDTHST